MNGEEDFNPYHTNYSKRYSACDQLFKTNNSLGHLCFKSVGFMLIFDTLTLNLKRCFAFSSSPFLDFCPSKGVGERGQFFFQNFFLSKLKLVY